MPAKRPSKIDRMPADVREIIRQARAGGLTIAVIVAALHERGAKVSRSAVGRQVQRLDACDNLGVTQELQALREEVHDVKAVVRAEIGRARGEVETLRRTIEALMAVLRERRQGGAAT